VILEIKRPDHIVPEYSLTGDLLAYRQCKKQYRYYNGSSLPPSRPVQLWYGEFIHGVLEQAYRLWRERQFPFPWPCMPVNEDTPLEPPPAGLAENDIRRFAWPVERALLQQNKKARSRRARRSAYLRAEFTVNMLGPHLFPLITAVEQRLIKTRAMPLRADEGRRAEHYVLTGIVDVLTNISLDQQVEGNVLADAIREACPDLAGDFEVIVDYKSSHRPPVRDENGAVDITWSLGEWQVKTYAWLRSEQPDAPRVRAGVLVYLNELSPSANDVQRLRRDIHIRGHLTDVLPTPGSRDETLLELTRPGARVELSREFRLRRAIRVIPIDEAAMEPATAQFDAIVAEIESAIAREAENGSIRETWEPTCERWQTCVACDFKTFCESPKRKPARDVDRRIPDELDLEDDEDEVPPEQL
jgi:hypothetical protein